MKKILKNPIIPYSISYDSEKGEFAETESVRLVLVDDIKEALIYRYTGPLPYKNCLSLIQLVDRSEGESFPRAPVVMADLEDFLRSLGIPMRELTKDEVKEEMRKRYEAEEDMRRLAGNRSSVDNHFAVARYILIAILLGMLAWFYVYPQLFGA